jgi:hypothetical protein
MRDLDMVQSCIPKRIIQTGKSSTLPLKEKASVCNLKLLNPDFEYLFFDDKQVEAFIDQYFPEYLELFDSFPFLIQRYDFFRYLAVYKYGGFYFDLDVFLASSLSGLLDSGCVFPFECLTLSHHLRNHHGIDWQIGNYAFAATQGHPFLKAVIENCVRAQKDPAWVQPMMTGVPFLSRSEYLVMNTTGPGLLTRTLAKSPALAKDVLVLFPDDVCDVRLWHRFGDLGVHLMDGSWRTKRGFVLRPLGRYWELWWMQKLLAESRKLGKARSHHAIARAPSSH